jgi:hypothetical protein
MLDIKLIESLSQIPPPVLTAYLETNPAEFPNQRHPPGYLIWLKSQAKVIEGNVPESERKTFREQIQRLEEHLTRGFPAKSRLGTVHSLVDISGVPVARWRLPTADINRK